MASLIGRPLAIPKTARPRAVTGNGTRSETADARGTQPEKVARLRGMGARKSLKRRTKETEMAMTRVKALMGAAEVRKDPKATKVARIENVMKRTKGRMGQKVTKVTRVARVMKTTKALVTATELRNVQRARKVASAEKVMKTLKALLRATQVQTAEVAMGTTKVRPWRRIRTTKVAHYNRAINK
jgi:hypothetical protein